MRIDENVRQRPLWLWPGVIIVGLQWLARLVLPIFENHPVLVGDLLLIRNGEEMVAFRLSLEASAAELG